VVAGKVVEVEVTAGTASSPPTTVVPVASTLVHAPPTSKRARKRGRIPRSG